MPFLNISRDCLRAKEKRPPLTQTLSEDLHAPIHIARICSAARHEPPARLPGARYNLRLQGPPPTPNERISDRAGETQGTARELTRIQLRTFSDCQRGS